MTSRRTKIRERIHVPIMRILQDKSDLSRHKLSELLGMSVGAAELLPQSRHRPMTNDIARDVGATVGHFGQISFDPSKPAGTPCKLMDGSLLNCLGWQAQPKQSTGQQMAHADFLETNA